MNVHVIEADEKETTMPTAQAASFVQFVFEVQAETLTQQIKVKTLLNEANNKVDELQEKTGVGSPLPATLSRMLLELKLAASELEQNTSNHNAGGADNKAKSCFNTIKVTAFIEVHTKRIIAEVERILDNDGGDDDTA